MFCSFRMEEGPTHDHPVLKHVIEELRQSYPSLSDEYVEDLKRAYMAMRVGLHHLEESVKTGEFSFLDQQVKEIRESCFSRLFFVPICEKGRYLFKSLEECLDRPKDISGEMAAKIDCLRKAYVENLISEDRIRRSLGDESGLKSLLLEATELTREYRVKEVDRLIAEIKEVVQKNNLPPEHEKRGVDLLKEFFETKITLSATLDGLEPIFWRFKRFSREY